MSKPILFCRRDIHREIRGIAEIYDSIAEKYESWRTKPWKISLIAKGSVILDLGSGPCENGLYIAERSNSYIICLDISLKMISIAKEKILRKKIFGDVIVANMLYIPLRNNSIDTILAVASIHHIPLYALRKTLRESIRILRRRGLFIATVWSWRQRRFLAKTFWNLIKTLLGLLDYPRRYVVPWRSREKIYERIYYLYDEKELRRHLSKIRGVKILSMGYVGSYRENIGLNLYFVATKTD